MILNFAAINIDSRRILLGNDSWLETGAPKKSMSLLAMHQFDHDMSASLGFYYTGEYQQLCCEEDLQDIRRRFDLVIAKTVWLGGTRADLKLVFQNITDEEVSTRLLNNYDRQGYVSLGVKF